FGQFFARLTADGITPSNTLFVFTSDEGDHFVGGPPSPANCNGVTTPCTYSQIGEINTNVTGLLATQAGITTPFSVHADSAPNFYLNGNPARDAAVTRTFERAVANLTAVSPLSGQTEPITNFLADPVEMKLLHMITADPARTPTFTMFANPNYFLFTGAANCSQPCVALNPAFAWNHGDVAPDINTTWLGFVGPGVRQAGQDDQTWADHTDIRPTIMALLGLQDDYVHDGRVLWEVMVDAAIPSAVRGNRTQVLQMAQVFKQLNAAVGTLGLASLKTSTTAIASNAANDATYTQLSNLLILD